jgi:hypothetical protein
VSKTLAVKAKSAEAIHGLLGAADGVFNSTEKDPVTTTTVQQLNEHTFHHVLNHVVTEEQRQRYLEEGNALSFGPDIDVQALVSQTKDLNAGPAWVKMPLQLTLLSKHPGTHRYIFVLSSPFITTPTTTPPPFGGMYYFKPLSPAQAYEWIVFDAFKKVQSES